jgi:hypothetical protein
VKYLNPNSDVSNAWLLNNDLYCATHPSNTSKIGPTPGIFSRYVDVVRVGRRIVGPETDCRILVIGVNTIQDRVPLGCICG